jgi:DNA gyrase subunit A
MLKDIEKDTVDFIDNYDATRKEPVVLPSPLPQLLLNGALGIAVGMATSIPPHNLSEVLDALIYLISHKEATTEDLFQFIKGPDFPTGGEIYDLKGIIESYSQGKGPILVRGKAEIVERKKDQFRIIISEIPFQVSKANLLEQMANLVSKKKIRGIKNIRDESDKEGLRIVIDLSQDASPQKILNQLYKFTDLQKTFYLNLIALVDGIQPRTLSLVDVLNYFIDHRRQVVRRRTQYDLDRAKERNHILEGLYKCLGNIDEVIRIIKNSDDRKEAEERLIKRFKLTSIQANAILETKLASLAKLERKKIEEELKETRRKIKELSEILKSPKKIDEVIKEEFKELKKEFKDERKTRVFPQKVESFSTKDLIPHEETIVTLTQGGYIKRMKPDTYRAQKRGGKGILGMRTVGEDLVCHLIFANTHDSLLFFTDGGKVFRTFVYEIPYGERTSRGKGIFNFLEIPPQEKILSVLPLSEKDKDLGIKYLLMVTKNGIIKKTALDEFKEVRRSGIIALSLKKGDLLRMVKKTRGNDEVILTTKKGMAIRFNEKEIRPMGRQASGVKAMRLKKDDEIIAMDVVSPLKSKSEKLSYLLVLTENGYGKRTPLSQYRVQKRGGSGIKTAKITSKTGEIVFAQVLETETEDIIVSSSKGNIIRTKIASVSVMGRMSQGVRIMKLEKDDKVASAITI